MKIFRKLWSFISNFLVIAIVLLAVALVGVRLFGLTPYTVLSGSMEPTYHVGSLIYVKDIAADEIKPGTVITFVMNEDLVLATHRVVDATIVTQQEQPLVDGEGQPVLDENGDPVTQLADLDEPIYYYNTKGDANDYIDGAPVRYENVVGSPVFSIPYLGYLSSWLQTRQGMIIGISVALVLVILTFMPDILRSVDDAPEKRRRKKRR